VQIREVGVLRASAKTSGVAVKTRQRTEIAHYTQADLDAVATQLNGRPRQTVGWKTPSQALDAALR
jgi:hypothetical protein